MKGKKTWNFGLSGWKRGPNKNGYKPTHCFKKGHIPWSKGKSRPDITGEHHPMWKGDSVGYAGVHVWIRKILGAPKRCDICGTTKAKVYNWSNKSGLYKRDTSDWQRLCIQCHRKYDNWVEKMLATRNKNKLPEYHKLFSV